MAIACLVATAVVTSCTHADDCINQAALRMNLNALQVMHGLPRQSLIQSGLKPCIWGGTAVCIETEAMIATLDPIHPHACAGSTFRARSRTARRCNARRKVSCQANDTAYYAAGSTPHAHSHRKKVVIVGGAPCSCQRMGNVIVLRPSVLLARLLGFFLEDQCATTHTHGRTTVPT